MAKLLIVDDESDIREFARNFFKKRKIEVFVASGGRQALDLIAKENPDLILLDVRMEEMTGIEVLRELRKSNPSVKVLWFPVLKMKRRSKKLMLLVLSGIFTSHLSLRSLKRSF